MTNWLLLISASTMMIFLQTCGRKTADTSTEAIDTSKTLIIYDSTTNVIDTIRFGPDPSDTSGIVPADEAGTNMGKTEKIPNDNPVKKDIPVHKTPDQAKLDSIKKAKEKLKKKSDNDEEGG